MKKRLMALLLSGSMACSLALPAGAVSDLPILISPAPAPVVGAEESTDQRLAAVTAKVKGTLELDTQEYSHFYGDLTDGAIAPTWYLEWSGDEGHMTVSATQDGKILSLFRYTYEDPMSPGYYGGFNLPAFPKGDPEQAQKAAQEFLSRVLTEGESVTVEVLAENSLDAREYRFWGEILINGLPAGLSCSVSVNCQSNEVTNFYRDDLSQRVMGEIPASIPAVSAEQAKESLRDTLSMNLEYVLSEDGKQAVLRYLPLNGDSYYVSAADGQLVNLTRLSQELEKGMTGGFVENGTMSDAVSPEAAPMPTPPLSDAELEGVEKLEGVLSRQELDGKARGISQLKLDEYTLSSANYTVSREEDGGVTVTLIYGRQVDGRAWRRTVVLDARTGALERVYSSAYLNEDGVEPAVDYLSAMAVAQDFVKQMCPDQSEKADLYTGTDAMERSGYVSHTFTFAQKANGWFFPTNSISVGVDSTDGSVSSFSVSFDQDVSFQSPRGALNMDQALDAWLNTYQVELGYVQVPAALDYSDPAHRPLMDSGISCLYRLELGYTLEREDYLLGIDAVTGEPVAPDWVKEQENLSYRDLSGHWVQDEAERLASYGVGYPGENFCPDQSLTQLDLVALLMSTQGYRLDTNNPEGADELYEMAFNMGILSRDERADDMVLTRSGAVKLILDACGYGRVASLQGIFRTNFADDADIPADHYGYVALAQGLGMISGVPGGQFLPNRTATRAQAAVMLYCMMDR